MVETAIVLQGGGAVNIPACSWYMPGLPSCASDRSTTAGTPGGAPTVSLRRHNVSRAVIGSPLAPPSTAAVIAPIDTPATATGRNPGRCS